MVKRSSIGRQKIEIKPILKEEARQVCFSKRRSGLFKKAHEISILCGAEVAVVVFSPAGKPFSFGHPSVDSVADRFLFLSSSTSNINTNTGNNIGINDVISPYHSRHGVMHALSRKHAMLTEQLEAERRRRRTLEQALLEYRQSGGPGILWDSDVEQLKPEELMQLRLSLDEVHACLARRGDQLGIYGPVSVPLGGFGFGPGIYGGVHNGDVFFKPAGAAGSHPGFGFGQGFY